MTNPKIEEVAEKYYLQSVDPFNDRHKQKNVLIAAVTEANAKLLEEIDKWEHGKFAELGNDFGENPLTLIKLLRAEVEELKADKERMDWLQVATNQNYLFGNFVMGGSPNSLRQAIDQARKV